MESTEITAFSLRIQDAAEACPFDRNVDPARWEQYQCYLENAEEPDSIEFYIDDSVTSLINAATEQAMSTAAEGA